MDLTLLVAPMGMRTRKSNKEAHPGLVDISAAPSTKPRKQRNSTKVVDSEDLDRCLKDLADIEDETSAEYATADKTPVAPLPSEPRQRKKGEVEVSESDVTDSRSDDGSQVDKTPLKKQKGGMRLRQVVQGLRNPSGRLRVLDSDDEIEDGKHGAGSKGGTYITESGVTIVPKLMWAKSNPAKSELRVKLKEPRALKVKTEDQIGRLRKQRFWRVAKNT